MFHFLSVQWAPHCDLEECLLFKVITCLVTLNFHRRCYNCKKKPHLQPGSVTKPLGVFVPLCIDTDTLLVPHFVRFLGLAVTNIMKALLEEEISVTDSSTSDGTALKRLRRHEPRPCHPDHDNPGNITS
jgi:hypothetical protein